MINLVNSFSNFATATPIEQEHGHSTPFEAMVQGFGLSGQTDQTEPSGQTGQERAIIIVGGAPQDRAIIIVGGAPQDRAIIIVGGKPQAAAHVADLSQTAASELDRATHPTSDATDNYKKHQHAVSKSMR